MDLIKVLLVIEVRLIGNIFASVLGEETDIKVAGCVTTLKGALEFIHTQEVDIVLVSAGLPDQGALEFTRAVIERGLSTKVLALGLSEENKNEALRYIEAGACGYILKDSSVTDLIEAIRLAQRGEAQISGRIAGAMMERLFYLARMFSAVENKMDGDVRLTSRELEVLQFIGEGLTNQEIAARLVVEVGTVKNHVHSILEKLNVSNREEAASYLAFIKK
ncbi:MAG TPA: response regulator transcription factor [Anaerolineales bacterium]|nr:response regulator transcription factor [Anaerolineales bacterium]